MFMLAKTADSIRIRGNFERMILKYYLPGTHLSLSAIRGLNTSDWLKLLDTCGSMASRIGVNPPHPLVVPLRGSLSLDSLLGFIPFL